MLFNNDIPDVSQVDFTINALTWAVGYSKHNPNPRKTGNVHEISFSKYYLLDDDDLMSVLIHEMIHLWQDSHVKEDRYKICSHGIAHDHVFIAKMNTINMLLAHNMYNIKISVVCQKDLPIDPACEAKTPFNIIFMQTAGGSHVMVKCKRPCTANLIEQLKPLEKIEKIFTIETVSYKFAIVKFSKTFRDTYHSAVDSITGEDMYEQFVNDPSVIWHKN